MKKHKEDLITPPWASKPKTKPSETTVKIAMATLWLTKNGRTQTITKPVKDIDHWRKKFAKDYVVTDTDPALGSAQAAGATPGARAEPMGHCGHECFKLRTGVACSRCKK